MTVDDSTIDAFREVEATSVCDVLDSLGIYGTVMGIPPLASDMKVVGTAVTMRQIVARDNRNWAKHEEVMEERCGPNDVLVIDMGGMTWGGNWGGTITIEAKETIGMNGVVVDGGVRDVEEIRAAGFPTFARGVTPYHTHGGLRRGFETVCVDDEPVQIGEFPLMAQVRPGDLVVGDEDGIAVVPADRAEEVLDLATRREENDEELKDAFRRGKRHGDPEVLEMIQRTREMENVEQSPGYEY